MIKTFSGGLLDSNVYVYFTDTGSAMIVDFGVPADRVEQFVLEKGLTVKYLVSTHGHYDHINYVGDYQKTFPNAKILCHVDEIDVIRDPEGNLSSYFGLENSYDVGYATLVDKDIVSLENGEGSVDFTVIHAPGHTKGCMCLYQHDEKIMFTGDVLFANGYGRVDLKYASPRDMAESLRMLYTYKGVKIYPGHGGSATI